MEPKNRYEKYNKKCKLFSLRFAKGKDDRYIAFLETCPNRMAFIRAAIDAAIAGKLRAE